MPYIPTPTRGHGMDHRKAYKHLIEFFGCKSPTVSHQKRGFIEPEEKEVHFKDEAG